MSLNRPYSITWHRYGASPITVYGETPEKAYANARRLRRDWWLAGKESGWQPTTREQWRWTRLARRIGLHR